MRWWIPLLCLAFAAPAQAALQPELGSDAGWFAAARVGTSPSLVAPLEGGGDGVVTGPVKTLSWILVGGGAVVTGLGVALIGGGDATGSGAALAGGGLLAILTGAVLMWTTGCVSCATCGIVENRPRAPEPADEALAGRRPTSDPGRLLGAWAVRF